MAGGQGNEAQGAFSIGAAIRGGIDTIFENRRENIMVQEASRRFRDVGTKEAMKIAGFIESNPRLASQFVERTYGSWQNLETGIRERASRERLAEKLTGLSEQERAYHAGEEGAADVNPHDVLASILPETAYQRDTGFDVSQAGGAADQFENVPSWLSAMGRSGVYDPESLGAAIRHNAENPEDAAGTVERLKPASDDNVQTRVGSDGTYTNFDRKGRPIGGGSLPGSEEAAVRGPGGLSDRLIVHEMALKKNLKVGSPEYIAYFASLDPPVTPFRSDEDVKRAEGVVQRVDPQSTFEMQLQMMRELQARNDAARGGDAGPNTSDVGNF